MPKDEERTERQFMGSYLIMAVLLIVASIWLTRFGWQGLNLLEERRSRCKVRNQKRLVLPLIARIILIANMCAQIFAFEFYVLTRMLMQGWSRNSIGALMCRFSQGVFMVLLTICFQLIFLFWSLRIPLFLTQSSASSLNFSSRTVQMAFAVIVVTSLLCLVGSVLVTLWSRHVVRLRSKDFNPYRYVNGNSTVCLTGSQSHENVLWMIFASCYLVYLVGSCWLAVVYIKQFRALLKRAVAHNDRRSTTADAERRVMTKSCTIAIVSVLSSIVFNVLIGFTNFWMLSFLDIFVNSLCVILYFEFAADYYVRVCSCFERFALCVCGYFADVDHEMRRMSTTYVNDSANQVDNVSKTTAEPEEEV